MDLNSITVGSSPVVVDDPEEQSQHSAAPTTSDPSYAQSAKTVVLALAGFMVIFYMLHIVERWAGGI